MPRRLFEIALADEIRAELARQSRTVTSLGDATGINPRTLRRRLANGFDFKVSEVDAIAAFLDIDVATLHERAHAAIAAAMRRHPAGSRVAS